MIELPSSALNTDWYKTLENQFKQEVEEIDQLPVNINNAPVLIRTQAGSFELGWDLDKQVLMIWVTNTTWEEIYYKIVKQDSKTNNYFINDLKRSDFLNKVKLQKNNSYLGSYPLSLSKRILQVTQKNQILQYFGHWVELAYLLPSYIPMHFGSQLEFAKSQVQKEELAFVQGYADEARKFFNQRGKLIGYGVGDSGLWLDGDRIYVPNRRFRLIWGLGGPSDFFFRTHDSSVECWELKTNSPKKKVQVPQQELTTIDSLRQVNKQAPAKLVCSSEGPLGRDILLVTKIGVLGIGRDSNGKIISHHESIKALPDEENLIEYSQNFHPQQDGVLNRPVRTIRLEQLVKQLPEQHEQLANFINRFELAAKIVEESVHHLIDALMSSSEWDSIEKALDEYHQRKYGLLSRISASTTQGS